MDEEAEELIKCLSDSLAESAPNMPLAERDQLADEFADHLGRLVHLTQAVPPSPARAAAMLYFYSKLGLDKVQNPAVARIMLSMVAGANEAANRAKARAEEAKGKPV